MARPSEDDRDAIDQAFAEMVAGYHLTADRPDPLIDEQDSAAADSTDTEADPPPPDAAGSDPTWADEHPLFQFEPEPEPEPAPEPEERFVPPEPPPIERPAWPVLLAWIGLGYAVIVVFAVVFGLDLPPWAGGLAVLGFVGAIGVLIARLPRRRPPDSGDGATL